MPGNGDRSQRKVFIGGLNYNSTEDSLKNHFSKFGSIVDVVVMKFPDSKRSRGFGFVTFATKEEVDACQENRPHVIDGKQVETKRATQEAGLTVKRVFVGGIKEDVTDEDILEYFSQFGKVESVNRMTDKESGKKRGFCFVEFDDYDPVDKAVLKPQHEINGKHVDVKKAMSKQDMRMSGGGGGGRNMARGGGGRGAGRGGFQNGRMDNQWAGPGGWSQGPGPRGGWAADGPVGWGGPQDYYQTGWGVGPGDFSCDQGGYGGGPMKPRGASGANRSAPYRGGQSGGFRGGRGRGGFRGRQM